jgi:hypothetical protein
MQSKIVMLFYKIGYSFATRGSALGSAGFCLGWSVAGALAFHPMHSDSSWKHPLFTLRQEKSDRKLSPVQLDTDTA